MKIGSVIAVKKDEVTIRIGSIMIKFEVEGHNVKEGDNVAIR